MDTPEDIVHRYFTVSTAEHRRVFPGWSIRSHNDTCPDNCACCDFNYLGINHPTACSICRHCLSIVFRESDADAGGGPKLVADKG